MKPIKMIKGLPSNVSLFSYFFFFFLNPRTLEAMNTDALCEAG